MNEELDEETGETSKNVPGVSKPTDIPVGNRPVLEQHSPNLGASVMFPSASPPSFVSLEQLLKAAEDVSKSEFDMALAHEISVNRDFKLEQNNPKTGLEKQVTEIFHRAFWDLLKQQLSSDPPEYTQAMLLLREIKEILLWLLLPHNTRLKNEIKEVLDLAIIEQQTKNKTIDVLSYANFIISTMSRICAPARDTNLQALRDITDTISLYKGILETLELMKIDMVNFTISSMRPHIQQHSIEYEQKKFREILNSLEGLTPPVDGLRFTRQWLHNVRKELLEESGDSDLLSSVVLRKAYLKILSWKTTETFPETLHLDHERFITLHDNLNTMVLVATVILVTYSNLGSAVHGITDFKNTLKSHLEVLLADTPQCRTPKELETKMETVGMQVVKETNECLVTHGYISLTSEQEATLISLIQQTANENHTVRQLIMKRILEFLELALTSTQNLKIPPGLSSLQKELSTFAAQFLALVKHNQSVFGDYYNDIIHQK